MINNNEYDAIVYRNILLFFGKSLFFLTHQFNHRINKHIQLNKGRIIIDIRAYVYNGNFCACSFHADWPIEKESRSEEKNMGIPIKTKTLWNSTFMEKFPPSENRVDPWPGRVYSTSRVPILNAYECNVNKLRRPTQREFQHYHCNWNYENGGKKPQAIGHWHSSCASRRMRSYITRAFKDIASLNKCIKRRRSTIRNS